MRLTRLALVPGTLAGLGTLALLSGCQSTVVIEPAPHATSAACADVMIRLPDAIGEFPNRKTSAQATDAWGDPTAVVLRCGMEPPAPTTDPCVQVDGVDWISLEENADSWRFLSYGRTPAVEVLVDPTRVSGANVLTAVSGAVSTLDKTGACVSAKDATVVDENNNPITPTATP